MQVTEGLCRHLQLVNSLSSELERVSTQLANEIGERLCVEERLAVGQRILNEIHEGIMLTDGSGVIEFVNPAFTRVTGYAAEEVVGNTPRLLRSGHHSDEFYGRIWQSLDDVGRWEGEIWNRRKNGEIYPEWLSIGAVRDHSGQLAHYIGIFTDITAQEEARRRIHYLAYYDDLTGLPNRLLFRDRLRQAVLTARRRQEPFALFFIDLDRFKEVNDTLGHRQGDILLRAVAERLRDALRESDTVARLGGDEFVILLPPQPHMEEVAERLAQQLLYRFDATFCLGSAERVITPSIGISLFPRDGEDEDALLMRADAAMYLAKAEGRNAYRFFDPTGSGAPGPGR